VRHDDAARVTAAIERALTAHVPNGSTLVIALSGGRDSVALLDATLGCSEARALNIVAVHVHHGLSIHADEWAQFCAKLCGARNVRFLERRVDVPRFPRTSVEAAARRVRYDALADAASAVNARALFLAHHQDDQAETVLLQLLRGAGPHGLAAMPSSRIDPAGWLWIRPLLDVPRSAIDAYIHGRRLAWIDDDSNIDSRFARNALRARVVPSLASVAGGYPQRWRAPLCIRRRRHNSRMMWRCTTRRTPSTAQRCPEPRSSSSLPTARAICCAGFCASADSLPLR
jgi:tRNA(Ile)-lysidine synthase